MTRRVSPAPSPTERRTDDSRFVSLPGRVMRDPLVVVEQLPTPTLTGSRCSLRRWELDDAEALRPACGAPEICRFTTVPHQYTRDGAERWIQRQHDHAANGTAIGVAIIAERDGPPVGMAGLFGLDLRDRTARLGYWIVATHRRRGLARNAARQLGDWAFSQLGLLTIYIDRVPDNLASARVAESLGAVVTSSRTTTVNGETITLIRHELTAAAHDQSCTAPGSAPGSLQEPTCIIAIDPGVTQDPSESSAFEFAMKWDHQWS